MGIYFTAAINIYFKQKISFEISVPKYFSAEEVTEKIGEKTRCSWGRVGMSYKIKYTPTSKKIITNW